MPLFSDTASAIKNPGALDFDEDDGKSTSCNGTFEFREDPSFWKNHNVQIREDGKKGIYVEYLTELEGASSRDVITQILQGATNRKVAATNMNHASSRSHSVFTCTIESKWESQGVTHHRFARLNLVDLEGSERQKSSGAEGERLKEATNINKSLSTLGILWEAMQRPLSLQISAHLATAHWGL